MLKSSIIDVVSTLKNTEFKEDLEESAQFGVFLEVVRWLKHPAIRVILDNLASEFPILYSYIKINPNNLPDPKRITEQMLLLVISELFSKANENKPLHFLDFLYDVSDQSRRARHLSLFTVHLIQVYLNGPFHHYHQDAAEA